MIHVRDTWSICGVFSATAFFRVWRFTRTRFATQSGLLRLPLGQLDVLTSPFSYNLRPLDLASPSVAGFTEVPGLTSLSRIVGNDFAFFPHKKCRKTPKLSHVTTKRGARCLQFKDLLGPRMLHSSCPGLTAQTKSPARVDQLPDRRPLLLCPAALEVSSLSDRRPWLGSDSWKVDV